MERRVAYVNFSAAWYQSLVMTVLVTGIHAFACDSREGVDAVVEPRHDEARMP